MLGFEGTWVYSTLFSLARELYCINPIEYPGAYYGSLKWQGPD